MPLLQAEIDSKNAQFWNELCGSLAAKKLKISDFSKESIKKFDDWFFSFYPYLKKNYLTLDKFRNKKVLEIGLGYGSVSQFLAENAAYFSGIDIAEGPVNFLNHRLTLIEKLPCARIMSVHKLNFQDNYFDFIVSIGCFHHTGNIKKCIEEVYRVLKPGGHLVFMCYNRYSLREFLHRPLKTFISLFKVARIFNQAERWHYDRNLVGESAPFTELVSKRQLVSLCQTFSLCNIRVENFDEPLRKYFLNNIGKKLGTDLYIQCIK
ncbi:MAG: class I SAM-dependent methyltransferase [Rickettsiella sp.]|nr:class I SAM-dependent methyltransferase [Rickettsiella sp.]